MAIDMWEGHECPRCSFHGHEVLTEERTATRLECLYCGMIVSVPPIERPKPEKPAAAASGKPFRFKHGRYAGKTLAEVDAEPNGRRYLEYMRLHTASLRGVIEAYLFAET